MQIVPSPPFSEFRRCFLTAYCRVICELRKITFQYTQHNIIYFIDICFKRFRYARDIYLFIHRLIQGPRQSHLKNISRATRGISLLCY